jgi:hypothetical protein
MGTNAARQLRWTRDRSCVHNPTCYGPLVMVHARALLTSSSAGKTAYLEADLTNPESILADPVLRDTLDLSQPVGLMLIAVLHFVPGHGAGRPIVQRLLDALPADSFLVATHATQDFGTPEEQALYQQILEEGKSDVWTRSTAEFTELFDGLELVEPGVVPASEWHPEPGAEIPARSDINVWTAVGRKP